MSPKKGNKKPQGRKRKHSRSSAISTEGPQTDPGQGQGEGSSNSQSDSREIKRLKDALAQKDQVIETKDKEKELDVNVIKHQSNVIKHQNKEKELDVNVIKHQGNVIEHQNKEKELDVKAYHKESLDFLIQKSLHLEDSISQIKAYGTNDLAIVKFVFDVSSVEDALDGIYNLRSHLERKNDERYYKNVGRLLIGATMFYRKAFDFPERFTRPTGTMNQTHREVGFYLEIENCQTDLRPLMDIFESSAKWKDLIAPIIKLYIHEYKGNPSTNESIAAEHMTPILHNLTEFLGILRSLSIVFFPQRTFRAHSWGSGSRRPDGLLYINKRVRMIMEFKVFSMLPKEWFNGPNEIIIEVSDMTGPFKQCFCYILDVGCPFALTSDGQTSALLVFDYERVLQNMGQWKQQGKALAPFRIYSSNLKSVNPSFPESHLAWMLRSENESVQKSKMNKIRAFYSDMRPMFEPPAPSRAGSRDSGSQSSIKSEDTIRSNVTGSMRDDASVGQEDVMDQYDVSTTTMATSTGSDEHIKGIPKIYINYRKSISIDSGYSAFQIFKVTADKVAAAGHNLNPKQQVVVKIFDDNDFFDYWSRTDLDIPLPIYMEECYQRERSCINRLLEYPEFNSCYFKHNEVDVMVNVGLWDAVGKCILSRFIETMELPRDDETYNKVRQQLDIIHKHGILHGDIKWDNILYSKEGIVYIIDFGVSKIIDSKHKNDYSEDDKRLWEMFHP